MSQWGGWPRTIGNLDQSELRKISVAMNMRSSLLIMNLGRRTDALIGSLPDIFKKTLYFNRYKKKHHSGMRYSMMSPTQLYISERNRKTSTLSTEQRTRSEPSTPMPGSDGNSGETIQVTAYIMSLHFSVLKLDCLEETGEEGSTFTFFLLFSLALAGIRLLCMTLYYLVCLYRFFSVWNEVFRMSRPDIMLKEEPTNNDRAIQRALVTTTLCGNDEPCCPICLVEFGK
jgi:hypothetical protein